VFSSACAILRTQEVARSRMTTGNSRDTTLKHHDDVVVHARTTIIVYHRDGATVVQLEKGRPVVLGRAPPADLEIPDPGLSRQHARFTWDDHGLWVEDLQSTNGTKKNGVAITRAQVMPGDEIALGSVVVAVHFVSSIDRDLGDFVSHGRFVAAFADEILRARTFGRPLALVLVRGADPSHGHVSRWASRLRVLLREVDRVGIYGPTAVLVSLPELAPDAVHALVGQLAGGAPTLACSVASFPADGGSVEELIAALHAAKRPELAPRAARKPDEPAGVLA
jgi:hypothetical protein